MQLELIQPSSLNETDLSRCVELVAQGGAVRPDDAAQGYPAEGRECRFITTCKETNLVSLKKLASKHIEIVRANHALIKLNCYFSKIKCGHRSGYGVGRFSSY